MSKQDILQKSKEREATQFNERVKKRVKENEQEKAEVKAARQLKKEDKKAAKADRKKSSRRKILGIFGGISDVLSRRKNFTAEELGKSMTPVEIISKYVDTYAGGKIYGDVFTGIGWAFKDAKTGKLTAEFLAPVKEPDKKWLSVLAEYTNGEIVKEVRQKDNPSYQSMLRKLRKPEPAEGDDKTESKKGKADKAKSAPKKDKADKAKSKSAPKKGKADDKAKSAPKKGKADKA